MKASIIRNSHVSKTACIFFFKFSTPPKVINIILDNIWHQVLIILGVNKQTENAMNPIYLA